MNSPMPVFTIKGKDALALPAIRAYEDECRAHGLFDQAKEVNKAYNEMRRWQQEHPDALKLPDHKHVSAGGDAWARGLCSDEKPHAQIDHFLGCVLAGKAQAPERAESVYEVWMPREQYDQIAAENLSLRADLERLREALLEVRGHSAGDPIRIENIIDAALESPLPADEAEATG